MTTRTRTRTAWGATRNGRTGLGLWGPAFAIGVLLAGATGVLAALVSPTPSHLACWAS